MKRIICLLLLLSSTLNEWKLNAAHPAAKSTPILKEEIATPASTTSFSISASNHQHSKAKTLMLMVGEHEHMQSLAQVIQFDVEFSDQVDMKMAKTKSVPDEKQLASLGKEGYTLVLTLEQKKSIGRGLTLDIALRDPSSNQSFYNKVYACSDASIIHQGHVIADELVPVMTGEKGPMLSTLAYCKQITNNYKVVCVSDYACRLEKPVVTAQTINVAPAWHSKANGLCYSQFTRTNSRLMYLDLASKKHKVVCSYDGLNMQPSFSQDGSRAALCLSSSGNSEIYMYDLSLCKKMGKRVFTQLTHNKGSNVSPCLLANDDLIFCSDFQTGSPQIYYRNSKTLAVKRLTNGKGYCAAPAHCPISNKIAYTRYVNGTFQLFTLALKGKHSKEQQLTFNAGDKLEPTWSECGRYLTFTYANLNKKSGRRTNQIAVLNTQSNIVRVLTDSPEPKSFPTWTGRSLYI